MTLDRYRFDVDLDGEACVSPDEKGAWTPYLKDLEKPPLNEPETVKAVVETLREWFTRGTGQPIQYALGTGAISDILRVAGGDS